MLYQILSFKGTVSWQRFVNAIYDLFWTTARKRMDLINWVSARQRSRNRPKFADARALILRPTAVASSIGPDRVRDRALADEWKTAIERTKYRQENVIQWKVKVYRERYFKGGRLKESERDSEEGLIIGKRIREIIPLQLNVYLTF